MSMSRTLAVGGLGIIVIGSVYLQAARPGDAVPELAGTQATTSQAPSSQPAPSAAAPSSQRVLLDKYCVTCHNEKRLTAGLALDRLDVAHVGAGAETWEKVVRKIRIAAMPPAGMPRPDKATYDTFASWLEAELDRAAATKPNPGRHTTHRLNRVEYTNAIRDLLALDIDGRTMLPADEGGYGFDNIADVLSLSPALLERYMSAAVKISRLAVGSPTIRPVVQTYRVAPTLEQTDRLSDDLPFGSRGGAAIRYQFPLDGEYTLRVRLQRQFNVNEIRGLERREQLEVRVDGSLLRLFEIGGECVGSQEAKCEGSGTQLGSDYDRTADDGLWVRVPVKAGIHLVGVAFLERTEAPEGLTPSRLPVASNAYWGGGYDRQEMGVDTVQISGPFNAKTPEDTPSRRKIFTCRPTSSPARLAINDEQACATKILSTLARRAYRRPVTKEDVQALLTFFDEGRKEEGGFEAGIQFALERILVAPDFLFRIERDPVKVAPGVPYRVSDLELASRLSFFLWSSIPDDELLGLAARGSLKDPKVLEQQVRRMLGDQRATALVTNFGGQWLYLRNMRAVTPDAQAFPEFDDNLREAFQRETELFLESQLRADRSVVELLTANYTFVNERLARHYGIPNVYGNHFRRVTLADENRAGLLGQGSILTVTSYATRTSPVVRGKWLLENFLAAPPPAPPPNVPPLKENETGAKPTSVRERLEQHRKNPVCAACHARMDPLGFALENFDGIGTWRAKSEGNTPVDASGVFVDGAKFDGPVEFRKVLLTYREAFVSALTEKMLIYALGRGLEYYDMPAIRSITRTAAPSEYRWSSIILGIVKSTPFQMRTAQQSEPVTSASSRTTRGAQ